jgi:paraquat-inducible protein A
LILLINADVGSGVSAEYILLRDGVIKEQQALLVASIFSSVKELWHNGSYPLAILVAITSVIWPYVKLFVSSFIWFVPYDRPRRRERLIEIMDALGKWSFVDIVVLVQIMVAFRSVQRYPVERFGIWSFCDSPPCVIV